MPLNLAQISRRPNQRRRYVELRPVTAPAMLATDLYQAAYRPVIALWQEAVPRIVAEYERTLSAMTTDSPADIQSEIEAVESALERLAITLTPAIRAWALRVERITRERWRGAVLAASNVDLSTVLSPFDVTDTLEAAIAWNTSLVRDVSQQVRQRIGNAVFDGLTNRRPAREVAKAIREATQLGRKRSLRVASDQLTKLSSRLAQARAEDVGLTEYVWVSSGKVHARAEHAARNGKIYQWAKPPYDGHPGTAINCGCHARSILRFDDAED